jgi:hypothetical protein
MKNESQLDITKTPVKWLTCIKVKGADYLWDPEIQPEQELEEEYEKEYEVEAQQETEQSAEEGAVEDPEEEYEVQPVSEKANGKRGVDEDFVETGPSVEPARKKGKGRAMEAFEEDNLDADDDDDAEGEEA